MLFRATSWGSVGAVLALGCSVIACGVTSRDDDSPAQRSSPRGVPAVVLDSARVPVRSGDGHPCDLVASPSGSDAAPGTPSAPLRSAQRIFDALRPGQTGCLRAGTYRESGLRIARGGAPGRRITLRNWPGERARIVVETEIYLPASTSDVTFQGLVLTNDPSSGRTSAVMIQDFSRRSAYLDSDISANRVAHCLQLGGIDGVAYGTVVRGNTFHDCGDPGNGNQDHAVYLDASDGASISGNVFWNTAAYAIHLYPDADRSSVVGNVIHGSGWGGVIFASDQARIGRASEGNLVARNVITGGSRYGIDFFWGPGGVGRGNRALHNCLAGNRAGDLHAPLPGIARAGNATAEPRYVAVSRRDFRLRPDSRCLGVVGWQIDTRRRLTPVRAVITGLVTPSVAGARIIAQRRSPSGRWSTTASTAVVGLRANLMAFRLEIPRRRVPQTLRLVVRAGASARGFGRPLRVPAVGR